LADETAAKIFGCASATIATTGATVVDEGCTWHYSVSVLVGEVVLLAGHVLLVFVSLAGRPFVLDKNQGHFPSFRVLLGVDTAR
jgi:hypothetical protein